MTQLDLFAPPAAKTVNVYLLECDHDVDPQLGPLWPAGFYAVMPDGATYHCAEFARARRLAHWKVGEDAVIQYHGIEPLAVVLERCK